MFSDELQAPRFITQPSASGSIVAVGRTKILQCQALGEFNITKFYVMASFFFNYIFLKFLKQYQFGSPNYNDFLGSAIWLYDSPSLVCIFVVAIYNVLLLSQFSHRVVSSAGFPQPQYRWLRDGDFISEFSSEHFYKIQSVQRTDAGSYQCIAKNSVGSILSEMIPLTVACE